VENSSNNTTENLMVCSLSNQQAWKILRIHSCGGNILWNGQAPAHYVGSGDTPTIMGETIP
jgi:hypothetical protein